MERQPNPEHQFSLQFEGGSTLHCNPSNTMIFLHSIDSYADHFWIVTNDDPEDEQTGIPVWRPQVENFDEMVKKLERYSYTFIRSDRLTEVDREMYNRFIERYPHFAPKLTEYDLTQRQEKLAWFVAYLLHKEYLTVEDFEGEGELFL